jgi:hypothetical protein
VVVFTYSIICFYTGADPGFQVRGAHLKKMRRAEGGAKNFEVFRVKKLDFMPKNHIFLMAEGGPKIFGVFRVENYNFTPKNHIFSNGGGRRENCWGISCGKSRFYAKKSYFFQF